MTKRSKNLGLILPTAAEDAAIAAGIAQDPDTMELRQNLPPSCNHCAALGGQRWNNPRCP